MVCCPQGSEQRGRCRRLSVDPTGAGVLRGQASAHQDPQLRADRLLTSATLPRDHRGAPRHRQTPAHPHITVPACRPGGTRALVQGLLNSIQTSWPTGVAKDRGHVTQRLWPQSPHTADPKAECALLSGRGKQRRTGVFPMGWGPHQGRRCSKAVCGLSRPATRGAAARLGGTVVRERGAPTAPAPAQRATKGNQAIPGAAVCE